jgi:hypothetical protein
MPSLTFYPIISSHLLIADNLRFSLQHQRNLTSASNPLGVLSSVSVIIVIHDPDGLSIEREAVFPD